MSDLGRLVERLEKDASNPHGWKMATPDPEGHPVMLVDPMEVQTLLSAARELEALKEAMAEVDSTLFHSLTVGMLRERAAEILAAERKESGNG